MIFLSCGRMPREIKAIGELRKREGLCINVESQLLVKAGRDGCHDLKIAEVGSKDNLWIYLVSLAEIGDGVLAVLKSPV